MVLIEMKGLTMRRATPAQKEAAQERRKRFRELAKQVADMPEADREALAAKIVGIVTVEGHVLSLHNMALLALQNPHVTIVGGFRQWINAGRAVRKGEHGLMIWVPISKPKDGVEVPDGAEAPTETRFLIGTVFDVSQTDEIEQSARCSA